MSCRRLELARHRRVFCCMRTSKAAAGRAASSRLADIDHAAGHPARQSPPGARFSGPVATDEKLVRSISPMSITPRLYRSAGRAAPSRFSGRAANEQPAAASSPAVCLPRPLDCVTLFTRVADARPTTTILRRTCRATTTLRRSHRRTRLPARSAHALLAPPTTQLSGDRCCHHPPGRVSCFPVARYTSITNAVLERRHVGH
jgi:hypothetical protein